MKLQLLDQKLIFVKMLKIITCVSKFKRMIVFDNLILFIFLTFVKHYYFISFFIVVLLDIKITLLEFERRTIFWKQVTVTATYFVD